MKVNEWAAFVNETGHVTSGCQTQEDWSKTNPDRSWRNPAFSQDNSHPAVCLNWHDAKAYVAWMSRKTGKTYRLQSEAEREYITRAGTTSIFWWGPTISTSQANYSGASFNNGPTGENRKRTLPAASDA